MDFTEAQKLVKEKDQAWQEWWTRMDGDADLFTGKPFVMMDYDNKTQVPDVDNVTIPRAQVFAQNVISRLNACEIQLLIEGKQIGEKEKVDVENFIRDLESEQDERLSRLGEVSLREHAVEQACIRGKCAERITLYKEDGELIKDILPIDARYLKYEFDRWGLAWASYKTYRPKAIVQEEYGVEIPTRTTGEQNVEVEDFWSRENNFVWSETTQLWGDKNKYKDPKEDPYVPMNIVESPLGTRFQGILKNRSESIYSLPRNLYPELNKIATMLQTMNRLDFRPGLQHFTHGQLPEVNPQASGNITVVEPGTEGFKPMPTPDARRALQIYLNLLLAELDKAELPAVIYGQQSFPMPATSVLAFMETKGRITIPRLQMLSVLMRDRTKMFIWQLQQFGKSSIEVGAEGFKRDYKVSTLSGKYTIRYKFHDKSPQEDVANYTVAAAAREFLPQHMINDKILKLDDPVGTEQELMAEQAEKMDLGVKLYRLTHSLIDQGNDIEARIIAQQCVNIIRQRNQGNVQIQPLAQGGNQSTSNLMQMFGGNKTLESNEMFQGAKNIGRQTVGEGNI